MFKKAKYLKNQKGLTLVELLAVIVILAIIAAIAVPSIGGIINNTRDKAVLSDIQSAISAAKIARVDGSCTENATTPPTTTCTGAQIEFTSAKIANATTGGGEAISIAFSGDTITVTATLASAMSGTRIPAAIGTPAAPFTGTNLVITEAELNTVLD